MSAANSGSPADKKDRICLRYSDRNSCCRESKVEVSKERPPLAESPRTFEAVYETEPVAVFRNDIAVNPTNAKLDSDLSPFFSTIGGGSTRRDRKREARQNQPVHYISTS